MDEKEFKINQYFKNDIVPPFDEFSNICSVNKTCIENEYSNQIEITKKIFNIQYFLAMKYGAYLYYGLVFKEKHTELIWSAFLKSMYSFHSAFDLNNKGLIGSSRILMRYIFEFLIIGKYASLSGDDIFLSRWENGEEIWMSKDIFKKILYPNSQEIKNVWKLFCGFAHGTKRSQQADLNWKENKNEISLNFILIWMLLEINYHLLNSHIINDKMRYYLREYGDYEEIIHFKNIIKKIFNLTKKWMGNEPKKVIYDYKLTWKFK